MTNKKLHKTLKLKKVTITHLNTEVLEAIAGVRRPSEVNCELTDTCYGECS
jgi:hypothetical protein